MSSAVALSSLIKPRFRGVSHQFAFFVFLVANATLLTLVGGGPARLATLVYAGSLGFLYGVSALYHRRNWGPAGRRRMRSLDHSAIFVLIAGSYTPLFLLLPSPAGGNPLLVTWTLAFVGITKSLMWPGSPKWVTAALAISVGWAVISHVVALAPVMGPEALWLLVASGVIYSIGGTVYALRRPDPLPRVFGYHEVFHAFVIVGSICHYAHVLYVLRAARAFGV